MCVLGLSPHPLVRPSSVIKRAQLCLAVSMAILGARRLDAAEMHESAPLFTHISQPAVIPVEVSGRGMFVNVMINGQGPFRMQLDTGCSFSMISPEVAAAVEAHGIDPEEADARALNGLGDTVSVPRVVLDSMTIGGVQFEGVIAGVIPLDLQSKIDSRVVDGLIGYTLFSDLFFALDFPHQTLVLSEDWPKNLPPVRAELAVTEHVEVPFITVKLGDRNQEVMIDTGANDGLHLPPSLAAVLPWKINLRPGFLLAVAGEVGREQVGRLSGTLELGTLEEPDPVIGISEGPPTLGLGLLRSFCVVFHEAEDKLWLCSPETGPLPSPPERSVGLSLFADTEGWRVAGIIPGSPAETAAVAPGDLVTQIQGQPARAWTQDQIQAWIATHPALSLTVASKSGARDLTLPVWSLVP